MGDLNLVTVMLKTYFPNEHWKLEKRKTKTQIHCIEVMLLSHDAFSLYSQNCATIVPCLKWINSKRRGQKD